MCTEAGVFPAGEVRAAAFVVDFLADGAAFLRVDLAGCGATFSSSLSSGRGAAALRVDFLAVGVFAFAVDGRVSSEQPHAHE